MLCEGAQLGGIRAGQVRGKSAPDLAGPEHHVHPGLTHDTGPLADPQV